MDIKADYSGEQLGNKYNLIKKLGNGGFGAVYKAFDRILNVEKAIKILEVTDPDEAYKLFSEAAIPYHCKHDNIIKINGAELIEFNGEVLFIIDMDLACGESIDDMLKHTGISVIDSLNIMKAILFAVEFSHIKKIIHRDIKPANILMDNGIPKLSDFGLSTALGDVIKPWKWYVTHAAPETFVDDPIATKETDIFALGMTLYRMVNRISDWDQFLRQIPNVEYMMEKGTLIEKLPVAPFVPDKVHRIVRKACRKDPNDRYRSAAEMRNAIEKLCFQYNWNEIQGDYWVGTALRMPRKEISIIQKRSSVEVVVKNNGRKSSSDSKAFTGLSDARRYMMEYIKRTTLQ